MDELRRLCERDKTRVILSGVHAQPLNAMVRSGMADRFGLENMTGTVDEALERVGATGTVGGGAPGRS